LEGGSGNAKETYISKAEKRLSRIPSSKRKSKTFASANTDEGQKLKPYFVYYSKKLHALKT